MCNPNTLTYQNILNIILLTLWQCFEKSPFLFQSDCVQVQKANTDKWKRFDEFGAEELDWTSQRPEFKPTEHLKEDLA